MMKNSLTTKKIVLISALLVVVLVVTVSLLFAYRTDLFVSKNRNELSLELREGKIEIPLKHKYPFYSPTTKIFKTDNTIEDIKKLFADNIEDGKEIKALTSGGIEFLQIFSQKTYTQSIFLEKYGKKNDEIRVGVIEFIPQCLYENCSDVEAMFKDKNKITDQTTYTLDQKRKGDSFTILHEYLAFIYEVRRIDDKTISVRVDGKTIFLKDQSN